MASQAKQRKIAKEWAGNDVICVNTLFRFPVKEKKGKFEIREAPWAYVNDLVNHVLFYLDGLSQ